MHIHLPVHDDVSALFSINDHVGEAIVSLPSRDFDRSVKEILLTQHDRAVNATCQTSIKQIRVTHVFGDPAIPGVRFVAMVLTGTIIGLGGGVVVGWLLAHVVSCLLLVILVRISLR